MTGHPILDSSRVWANDPKSFWREIAGLPEQCRVAQDLPAPHLRPRGQIRQITIVGMGGSAAGADLLRACVAGRFSVPIHVSRGEGLPPDLGPETLLIAVSYSGDTEETLTALEEALEKKPTVAVVTSGGVLAALAERRRLPSLLVPCGLMPRSALGFLFFALVKILEGSGLTPIPQEEVAEGLRLVEDLGREFALDRPTAENAAKRLAVSLETGIPVLYGGPTTAAVAYRWKTQIDENAKRLAVWGVLPEANHNDVEAWSDPESGRFHAIFLRDRRGESDFGWRIDVTRDLLRGRAGSVSEVWARGAGLLARLFSLVVLGDWMSYYLASLRGVDPRAVPSIDELKRRLRRHGQSS